MSTNQPPPGPPHDPSGVPVHGTPEVLEQGGGGPLPPSSTTGAGTGGGRRRALVAGGVVGVLALGGVAFGAWSWLSGTGDQPAEALPADTLGYLSVDLDPSGSQKIEALRTLRKFPAFKDEIGLDTDDDLRERIVEEALEDAPCDDLSYADDIEPWLGDRFAVAAVGQGEGEEPAPVLVLQVTDADAAETGFEAIRDCAAEGDEGGDDEGGWAVDGDWAVVAETDEIAQQVVDDAAEASLADDEDFGRWTEAAGDPGIMSGYASPGLAEVLSEGLRGFDEDLTGGDSGLGGPDVDAEALDSALEGFEGAGLHVRFSEGSLEVEVATDGDYGDLTALGDSDQGATMLETLPDDTALALGIGFEPGWFSTVLDNLDRVSDGEVTAQIEGLEAATGLDLSEDVETLLGESAALAVSSDLDPEVIFNSGSGLGEVPVGLKVKGDPDAVEEVLDDLAESTGGGSAVILGSDSEGDVVAIGPDDDYLARLLEDGGLGDTDVYQDVVRESDVASALFVSFDALDDLVADLASGDDEVVDNLAPLAGLGISGWIDDGVGHAVLRVTTDRQD